MWRRLTRHAPVNVAAAGALLTGWTEAVRVARAAPPEPRLHVPWHALEPHEARTLLRHARTEAEPVGLALLGSRVRQRAARLAATGPAAPARWTWEAAGAVRRELDDPLTPVLATGAVARRCWARWWTRCSCSARWTSTRSRAASSGCAPNGPSPGSPPASSPARAAASLPAAPSPSTPHGCGRATASTSPPETSYRRTHGC